MYPCSRDIVHEMLQVSPAPSHTITFNSQTAVNNSVDDDDRSDNNEDVNETESTVNNNICDDDGSDDNEDVIETEARINNSNKKTDVKLTCIVSVQ